MTEPLPKDLKDYNPKPEDRVYYESVIHGYIGYLVKENDKLYIDRGNGLPKMLYRNIEWKPIRDLRPITEYHVGKVAFEADKALLFAFGRLKESRRDWQSLTQDEKMEWVHGPGPTDLPARRKLYLAIFACLKELVA